jgi:radical SAM superfamily enzyme YgiQ (UPF0313 family)
MKVCLVHPAHHNCTDDRLDPPLGLLYLATALRDNGVEVSVSDLSGSYEIDIPFADVYGITAYISTLKEVKLIFNKCKQINPNCKVVVGGAHASVRPNDFDYVDKVIMGQGEEQLVKYVTGKDVRIDNISIFPSYDLIDIKSYHRTIDDNMSLPVLTSRGCPFKCLTGDTIIHTMEGDKKIEDLVGKEIFVLSRDNESQRPIYTKAINIQKTGTNEKIIRVHFKDGSHIDCTPDHRFKVFKSKNQYISEKEWDVEAKDLKLNDQVRAVRFEYHSGGRKLVSTRRDITLWNSKLVYEAYHQTTLNKKDIIHHKDRNPSNDSPENLALTDSHNHIKDFHPYLFDRMKYDNPAKHMTDEWKMNISKSGKGKKRTLEQRLKYRESKLGPKNPNYRPDIIHRNRDDESRILKEVVNHKVLKIEELETRQDVYCMEVPETNWFYANKVLVHNCSFCGLAKMHSLDRLRMASPEQVYDIIKNIVDKFGIININFQDDIFTLNLKRLKKILKLIKPFNIKFRCMGRAGYDTEETYELLAEAGCYQIAWGIESGSQYILDRMIKQVTVEENYNVIQWAKKYGIIARAFFIIGFPGETSETLEQTKQFIIDSKPDQFFVSNFIPYPATDVELNPDKYGITNMSLNYDHYYQVSKDGTGGAVIDTRWLTRKEFKELELKFRNWIKHYHVKGKIQKYEERLYNNEQENIDSNPNNDNGVCEGVC